MSEQPRKVPIEVPVKDKRRVKPETIAEDAARPGPEAVEAAPPPSVVVDQEVEAPEQDAAAPEQEAAAPEGEPAPDYLGDLQRLQAEFENYRKRMMRQIADESARGASRLVEKLLPVLDNFELAIAHGEGGEGVEMVFKELRSVLESAGLEEISGEGTPFDPNVHQAVESVEDDSVAAEVVRVVHRRGYMMNGKLLRAAMVGVARPPEQTAEPEAETAAEG